MVVMTALASSFAYAVAMVLQQRGAERTDPGTALKPGLLVQLAAQPWWLVGIAANLVAFGLRALALANGSLVLVQPVLLTGLIFALILETRLCGRRFTSVEGWASVALVTGLSLFAVAASPGRGDTSASVAAWLLVGAVVGVLAAVAIGRARAVATGGVRAAWLGGAGGVLLAALAALTKQATAQLADDGLGVLLTWTPYVAAAVGAVAVVVTQSAFQTAPLRASLPVLSVVEPVTSIAIGAWAFHEPIDTTPSALVAQAIGMAVMLGAAVTLTSRDPSPGPGFPTSAPRQATA